MPTISRTLHCPCWLAAALPIRVVRHLVAAPNEPTMTFKAATPAALFLTKHEGTKVSPRAQSARLRAC